MSKPDDDSGDSPHERATLKKLLSLLHRAPHEEDKEAKENEEEEDEPGLAGDHQPEVVAGDHLPEVDMQMLGTPEMERGSFAASSFPPRGALKRCRAESLYRDRRDIADEEIADEDTSHACRQCSQLQWDKNFLLECASWSLTHLEQSQKSFVESTQREFDSVRRILQGFSGEASTAASPVI